MNYNIIVFIAATVFMAIFGLVILMKFHRAYIVPQGYLGLLYNKGKFIKVLPPGRHILWGLYFSITLQDVRKGSLLVPGQEVLTSDNVGVKLSVLISYQIVDPEKAAHETQSWQSDLYNTAQVALRAVVSGVTVEALLNQRLEIGTELLGRVQPLASSIGITAFTVEVKDVILPPDLKRAFGEVLKAKQEGQATLERARGESASLRNLANAARVLEGNPALMNLRLMQSITAAQNAGNTLVMGLPAGFVPLKKRIANHSPDQSSDS